MMEQNQSAMTLDTFSASWLQAQDLPPLTWVVDTILPEGLAFLLAPPKSGKSFFAQQLCYAVATGSPFLGLATQRGAALYLALESSQRQLQDRLENYLTDGETAPASFLMATAAARIDAGLIEQLSGELARHPDLKLVVVDVLAKVRPVDRPGANVYAADYAALTPLQHFAVQNHLAVLLLHHHRKVSDDVDFLNDISGSTGLTGCADTIINIRRASREDPRATFLCVGRDVELTVIDAIFEASTCLWKRTSAAPVPTSDPLVRAILTLLERFPDGWQGTLTKFCEITGYQAAGGDAARSAGRHLNLIQADLTRRGICFERVKGVERNYRFWSDTNGPEPVE